MDGNGEKPTQEVDWFICPNGHEGGVYMTFILKNIPNLPFPSGPENHYCMACLLADAITRLKLKPLKHEIRRIPIENTPQEGG